MTDSVKNTHAEGLDAPVFSDLASQMNVDLVVNDDGSVWLLHDKPFSDFLRWVEYDAADNKVTIVTQQGRVQDLGMVIPAPMIPAFLKARDICIAQLRNKKIHDMYILPFLARDAVMH